MVGSVQAIPQAPPGGVLPRLLTDAGRGTAEGEEAEIRAPDMTKWAPTQQELGPGRQEQRQLQAGGEQIRGGVPAVRSSYSTLGLHSYPFV